MPPFETDSWPFSLMDKIDLFREDHSWHDTAEWGWPVEDSVAQAVLSGESDIFGETHSKIHFNQAIPSVSLDISSGIPSSDQAHIIVPSGTPPVKLSPSENNSEQFPEVPSSAALFADLDLALGVTAVEVSDFRLEGQTECIHQKQVLKRKASERDTCADDSDMDSPTSKRTKKQRGMFARLSPQIQQNARLGQRHWGEKVHDVRAEWTQRCTQQHNAHFSAQIAMCTRLHIKSQHECILRQLQMAAVDGIIVPSAFTDDDTRSFLGWTGFEVVSHHAAEFRRRIEGMFAAPPNDKTLNNTMRRAGLVPSHSWSDGWGGKACFVYDATKRASYGRD